MTFLRVLLEYSVVEKMSRYIFTSNSVVTREKNTEWYVFVVLH